MLHSAVTEPMIGSMWALRSAWSLRRAVLSSAVPSNVTFPAAPVQAGPGEEVGRTTGIVAASTMTSGTVQAALRYASAGELETYAGLRPDSEPRHRGERAGAVQQSGAHVRRSALTAHRRPKPRADPLTCANEAGGCTPDILKRRRAAALEARSRSSGRPCEQAGHCPPTVPC